MKAISLSRCLMLAVGLLAVTSLSPAYAKDKTSAPASTDSATAETAVSEPKTAAAPGSVSVGDLVISHMSAEASKSHIDVFMTIKNGGKADERITGAGSTWDIGDVVQVKKDKDGKETEAPVAIEAPADKSTELSDKTVWLRIKDVKTKAKPTEPLPLTLYFRHSPNAPLQIKVGEGKSGGWFSE